MPLLLIVQTAVTVGVSALTAYWLGAFYLVIAGLIVVTVSALLVEAARRQLAATAALEAPPNWLALALPIIVMALALGVIWPALPLIVGWGAYRSEHANEQDGN